MLHLRLRALVAAATSATLVLGWATNAPATPLGSPAPSVSSLQSQAKALEADISSDTEAEMIAGEHFDNANVQLSAADARLSVLRKDLVSEQVKTNRAKAHLRSAAVAAYVFGDSAAAQFGAELTNSVLDAGTVDTYAGVATGQLHSAVVALQGDEQRLQTSEATEATTIREAGAAVAAAAQARAQAESLASSRQAALHQVKGQIAQVILEQERARAAAFAARARAARAKAEREQAAADAEGSVSVIDAIENADPSAANIAAVNEATAIANSAGSLDEPALQEVGTSPAGNAAVQAAELMLGIPYVWGGASSSGVDCSGMTMLAWAAAGVALTHSAWYQYRETTPVSLTALEPGDLLFYYFPNDGQDPVTHVAMFVGQGPYGTQTIIQAPETGLEVSYAPMYYPGLVGAGRPVVG